MDPRERVMLALDHKEPDRSPIDLGTTIVSSIVKNSYISLKEHFGIPLGETKLLDNVQQLPYLDENLLQRCGVDFRLGQ